MTKELNKSGILQKATWSDSNVPEWFSRIGMEELEKLASLGYTPEKIAMYYKVNKHEFMFYFMLIESKLKFHYDRGILVWEAKEGQSMLSGSLENATTAQRLDKLRKKIEYKNSIENIMYGGF